MRFAYIENGIVYDSIMVRPESVFYPDYASKFVEVPDEVRSGWKFDGTNFAAPPEPEQIVEPTEPTKEELLAQLQTLTQQIQALT
jgi:hypothetical protein